MLSNMFVIYIFVWPIYLELSKLVRVHVHVFACCCCTCLGVFHVLFSWTFILCLMSRSTRPVAPWWIHYWSGSKGSNWPVQCRRVPRLLLPSVHTGGWSWSELSHCRHCGHLWLRLEPTERPPGSGKSTSDWSDQAGVLCYAFHLLCSRWLGFLCKTELWYISYILSFPPPLSSPLLPYLFTCYSLSLLPLSSPLPVSFPSLFPLSSHSLSLSSSLALSSISFPYLSFFLLLGSCIWIPGEHLSASDTEQCGGGHRRAGKEEDGTGPLDHPKNGHYRPNCSLKKFWTIQVSCLWHCTSSVNCMALYHIDYKIVWMFYWKEHIAPATCIYMSLDIFDPSPKHPSRNALLIVFDW